MATLTKHITETNSAESEIIPLLARKDKRAITLIFDNYSSILFNIIQRVLKNEELSEDVLQEVLLKVWKNANQFDRSKGSLFTWLSRISRNAALDKIKSRDFKDSQKSEEPVEVVSMNVADQDSHMEGIYLKQVIQQLPKEQSLLIDMAYFQGYTQKEISEKEGIPLGTVKTRIRLAIKHLRTII